ncbi:MAG: hypothetical protein JNM31_03575 [Flavobacteriales bacterium]|nr:hypothetical protein [Flavobacteriales bacterium]
MFFVWSYLSDGKSNHTLVQVSLNDLLVLFIPIVRLVLGIAVAASPGAC